MTTLVTGPWTAGFPTGQHLTVYDTTPYAYGIQNASATQLHFDYFDSDGFPVSGGQWQFSNNGTSWTNVGRGGQLSPSGGSSAVRYVIVYFQAADNTATEALFSMQSDGGSIPFAAIDSTVNGWSLSSLEGADELFITNNTGATGLLSLEFQLQTSSTLISLGISVEQTVNLQAAALFVDGDPPCFGPRTRILCPSGDRVPIPRLFPQADVVCVSPDGTRSVATARILRQPPANRPTQRVFMVEDGVEVTKHHQLLVRDAALLLRPAAEWYCSKCADANAYMSCPNCAPDLLTVPGYQAIILRDVVASVATVSCEQVYHVHFEDKTLRRHLVVVGDHDTLSETLRSSPLQHDWDLCPQTDPVSSA